MVENDVILFEAERVSIKGLVLPLSARLTENFRKIFWKASLSEFGENHETILAKSCERSGYTLIAIGRWILLLTI